MDKLAFALVLLFLAAGIRNAGNSFVTKEDKYGREYLHQEDLLTNSIHHIIDAGRKAMEVTPERYTSLMNTIAGLKNLNSAVRDTPILEC